MKLFNHIKFAPCILVLASGVLAYKNIIFSTGPAFQVHDVELLTFPKYYFMRKAFMMGEFPFWDSYTMLGQPCSFGMGLAMLYPFLLGFLSFGFLGPLIPRHLELFIVGHLLFSGFTMYWSARKLGLGRLGACLAGIVFQMAIINKDVMYSIPIALGLPWIPLSITYGIIVFRSRAPALSKENIMSLIITILTLTLIISTTYPNIIVYTFLTLCITVIYYTILRVKEKDWAGVLNILKKSILVFLAPLLLTTVVMLPGYAILKDSVRFGAEVMKFGPLYLSHVWTLLFPGFANSLEPPFAYLGVIVILLSIYFCLTKNRKGIDNGFLFVIFAVFWFYYSVEDSRLDRLLSIFPVLDKMRLSQFAIIIYVYAVAILAGKGLERLLSFRENSIRFNVNWIFPGFLIFILVFSWRYFFRVVQDGYNIGNFISISFGITFIFSLIMFLIFKLEKLRLIILHILPVIVIAELFMSSPPFYGKSEAGAFFPYDMKLDRLKNNYPGAFLNNDLYRIENFTEYPMAEYYFNRFSTYGYYGQGMHPARYYNLWDISGKKGPRYEKWWVEGDRSNWVMPISLESKLYDLAGVKYLYLPEHEWLFIDYKQAGKGEWIEMELAKDVLAYGVGLYNAPGGRWPTEVAIVLNGVTEINIEVPETVGWNKFYFNPVVLNKLRIIVKEVVPYDINAGSRGVVIGEVELLDKEGNKLDAEIKDFRASSSMLVSNPSMVMDNRLGHVWHSGCSILANNTLPSKNLERLKEGCYINKDVLARAFVVHRYKYFKDIGELRQELHSDSFEPGKVILLEGLPMDFNIPDGPYSDNVEIVSYRLNKVEISVKNDKPGILILTDMYAPGWQVFVDGVEDKLLIADGLFRGVFIEDGEHKVLFRYRPPFLKLGLIISLLTLVGFIKVLSQRLKGTEGTKKKHELVRTL